MKIIRVARLVTFALLFGCDGGSSSPDVADADDAADAADVADVAEVTDAAPEIEAEAGLPHAAGSYDLATELAPLGTVPDDAQAAIERLSTIVTDPGEALLHVLAATASAGSGTPYWESDPWSLLFDFDADTGQIAATTMGRICAAILEAELNQGLAALGSGDDAATAFARIGPILDNAESCRLDGTLVLSDDAAPDGDLGAANSVVYNEVTWTWVGAGSPRTFEIPAEPLPGSDAVAARFASFEPPSLAVDRHEVRLDYIVLLTWVVEYVGFPVAISPEVSGFPGVVAALFDCERLANHLACEGEFASDPDCDASASFAADATGAACRAVVAGAASGVSDWLRGPGSVLRLGTPTDAACAAGVTSGSIDRLGEETTGARCAWDGVYVFESAAGAAEEPSPGEWWATRL